MQKHPIKTRIATMSDGQKSIIVEDVTQKDYDDLVAEVDKLKVELLTRFKAKHGISDCAFCGWIDHRHRTTDAQMERIIAGDPIQSVAEDFGTDIESMIAEWRSVFDVVFEFALDQL